MKPATPRATLESAMARAELPQTPSALMDLAAAQGYDARELGFLRRGLQLATALFDGGYRPCGRAFVQHGIGTAGVLVRYRLSIDVVLEALLHAAYTHRRLPIAAVRDALASIHPVVEQRVRDYGQRRKAARSSPVERATPREAEIAAIEAANEIDMRFSGEYDHSGKRDEVGPAEHEYLAAVLGLLGAPGMARTLATALGTRRQVAPELQTRMHESYRLGPGNRPVRMAGGPV